MFFQEQIISDYSNLLLGQDDMFCELEKSSRCLVCLNIVSLHTHTTHLTKFILTETNRKLREKLSARPYQWFKRHENQLKWIQQWEWSSGKTGGMDEIKCNGFKLRQVRSILDVREEKKKNKNSFSPTFWKREFIYLLPSHVPLHWKCSFLLRRLALSVFNGSYQTSTSHEGSQRHQKTLSFLGEEELLLTALWSSWQLFMNLPISFPPCLCIPGTLPEEF